MNHKFSKFYYSKLSALELHPQTPETTTKSGNHPPVYSTMVEPLVLAISNQFRNWILA